MCIINYHFERTVNIYWWSFHVKRNISGGEKFPKTGFYKTILQFSLGENNFLILNNCFRNLKLKKLKCDFEQLKLSSTIQF